MMDDRGRVHREVKGPKPYVVAFRAKLPNTAEDSQKQLFYWRAQEAKRHEFACYANSHHIGIIKGKMEKISEQKRHRQEVQKRIGMEMQAYLAGEEERKERLRDLLETEEKGFIAEMESQGETIENRVTQLALKEELNKQKEKEEAMYNALWEEDRLAKEKRASEEANKRSDLVSNPEEERQLMKLEKEQAEIERQRKLRECRDMLLDAMKKKARRLNEERQNELALEMKILDHVLQESLEDTESQKQRKRELLQEQQMYRAYLAQQREEERRQEEELNRLRAEDAAKMWAKRAEKERALKLARDRLLKEVMDTRKLQIENKCKELRLQQSKQYREELRGQIDHRKEVHEMEKEEERREYALAEEAEKLYHQKLADILSRPYMKLKFMHPLRRQLVISSKS
ncbi:hypothetical protein E2320_017833 [Naja naja]|nr:hypothetical protein E2320_017833 [Naja naja]